ncbi:metal ABC transporter permease [Deinococcus deserti]|uniref:Putative Mn2+/Zn2+ ABC transporter, permease component n=1 Tax=Deinococcus deserti (strain DSM 17065 / CIP 109153 / LMG 22923 / VCD115) TaxID=546414 RepID=C1D315_DEIDV|nr:metal ABC transporter permease [Deinococcus deserti]ACO47804.1 putative Mn2+/Zn2+ ABC transporter, permease component [Deinococcus deserti VCD115]
MNPDVVIILTAALVAVAGSLLGVFLVLRRQSMMSDAISHSVLPGIVGAFWISGGSATLPALVGAAMVGLLTVGSVQLLERSGRLKADAAIGVVFPLLFSVGVILVSLYFRDVHLDLDAVLYGEIAYAPLNTLVLGGREVPESLLLMGGLAALNFIFVTALFKELKVSTFDPGLAATLGFVPAALHYALMTLLSFTTVGAFQSVGAVLIVAFVIIPPACAFLLTQRLAVMLWLSAGIGVLASAAGYGLALWLNSSIAGMIATVLGVIFVACVLFSPLQGLVATQQRRSRQRQEFSARLLLTALHEQTLAPTVSELASRLEWTPALVGPALAHALRAGWLVERSGRFELTEQGRLIQHASFRDVS